jgi:hypothetical protein
MAGKTSGTLLSLAETYNCFSVDNVDAAMSQDVQHAVPFTNQTPTEPINVITLNIYNTAIRDHNKVGQAL